MTTNAPARAQAAPQGYVGGASTVTTGDMRSTARPGETLPFEAAVLSRGLAAAGFVDEKKPAPRASGAT